MSSELSLVTELAVILISAGIFTIISKALKQPLILGYIVAGFIVGPHLGLFPQFSPESVHQWSELGIIFLLFGLGLEFNFKKLLNVGSSAIITAGTICIGMFLTGFITGTAMDWSKMECIFLGGMLSMSSTTIIIKAYDDLGLKNAPYASLVFGLLVVEDLLAVLMMVIFSTLAVSNKFDGMEMLLSLAKLVSFLVICFIIGIYILPSVLKRTRKYLSQEILLLISVGLCFLMVILANKLGFSSALGAFLMGSILSSTIEGEEIEHITINIKNLFGAIFFVSVGMMVDPAVIAQYWPVILLITLVVLIGILVFSTCGAIFAGRDLDTALHVGFSLPQLGEFSFIIAGLGCSLGVVRDFIYPVIIAVSVITTFTTPYMIKAAGPASVWLHAHLPSALVEKLRRNQQAIISNRAEANLGRRFVKKYVIRLGIYSLLIGVLLIGIKEFVPKLVAAVLPSAGIHLTSVVEVVISLLVLFPFLYGLAVNGKDIREMANTLVENNPRTRIPVTAAVALRIFLAVGFALSAILLFSRLSRWNIAFVIVSLVAAFLFARRATKRYTRMEDRFFKNLNEKEEKARRDAPVRTLVGSKLAGYDVHIEAVTVSPDFALAGLALSEMPFRQVSGVNIVKIQRGSRSILIPRGDEIIMPADQIFAVGTKEQLKSFMEQMEEHSKPCSTPADEFAVEPIELTEKSPVVGKMLKDTDMRDSGCMVISVERNGLLQTNPSKDFKFAAGDIIWMAGLRPSIEWYKSTNI